MDNVRSLQELRKWILSKYEKEIEVNKYTLLRKIDRMIKKKEKDNG